MPTMPKNTLIVLGVFVAVMPFIGIPGVWKTPLYFLLGVGIAASAYQLQYKKKFHLGRAIPLRKPKNPQAEDVSTSASSAVDVSVREQASPEIEREA